LQTAQCKNTKTLYLFRSITLSTDIKKYIKILFITFASVITFLVQIYAFPDAGKTNISKFSEYSFQMNYWSEEIHEKFDFIKYSHSYKNLSLYTGEKTVSKEFFDDIEEYHYQVKGMLRVLKRHSGVAVNTMGDTEPLLNKAAGELGVEKLKLVHDNYKEFERHLDIYDEKLKNIEDYIPKLRDAFTYQGKSLSEEDTVELSVKQIELLKSLYSSENLFLRHGSDPFKFVGDFASASDKVLMDYRRMNTAYNDVVSKEESIKNSIILFLIFITAYITFRKEN
jgi:translation initiation factor 2 beta subunit (eIF-2beta)/eIF-5